MEPRLLNEFDPGIPTLDLAWQARYFPDSWEKWGTIPRSRRIEGKGYYLYCSDYKFTSLWKKPWRIPQSGCACTVEINYSTRDHLAGAAVLYRIYRKRLLARHWGEAGVPLFVDLNVSPRWRELNLTGVPRGWTAWATRSHADKGCPAILADHELACAHAGTSKILFAVFGGVGKVRALCLERGWHHVPEQVRRVRGIE